MNFSANQKWSALFALWTLHGLVALLQFISLPAEGFSLARAAMVFVLLGWIIFCAALTLSAWNESARMFNLLAFIQKPNVKDIIFISSVLTVLARVFLAFLHVWSVAAGNFSYSGYVKQLDPVLNLITFVAAEIAALVLFFAFRNWRESKNEFQGFIKKLIIVLTALGLVALLIHQTGLGITPGYQGDWSVGIPAVPLLEWQIVLACVFCVGMVVLESKQQFAGIKNRDAWICFAVWVIAAALWLSQPVVTSSSALEPREPNFEIYPFNDAQVYDQYSQSVLIGGGYGNRVIPQRPLYIVLLVLMHVVAGQNYDSVIILQSLLFAFFPVLLYLFGKEFFGRPIGIAIALLAILRDFTSNMVAPFTGNLSYSKLYLAEIPTALLLVLLLWVGLRWIKSGFPLFTGFLLGGILGVGMLLRTQVVTALPVLILFALLTRPKLILPALKSSALALIAIAIVVSPWLMRNRQLTGELIFDNPTSQTINLALRYSRLNGKEIDVMPQPGESDAAYNDRMIAIARSEISSNPWGAVTGVANFFINHGINNILLFPMRYEIKSFSELWKPANSFWQGWRENLRLPQFFLLGFYVFLFGLGVAFVWQRLGWLGLLPLGVNLAYNLWTSLALLSGQRFMLTMDWSVYTYYMIGLFGLLSVLLFGLERGRKLIQDWYAQNQINYIDEWEEKSPYHRAHGDHRDFKRVSSVDSVTSVVDKQEDRLHIEKTNWRRYVVSGVVFLGIGASLWLVELAFPQRYSSASQSELMNRVVSSSSFKLDAACFQKVITANGINLVQGRALYPRYYWADDGETFTDSFGYKKEDKGRIVFEMIGPNGGRLVIPIAEPVEFFPHAADVTLGWDSQSRAWFVLVEKGSEARFYLSDLYDDAVCR
jgi:4-amino-4-deoxy-L-arabinose transferase-like glycosyltransferase